MLLDKGIPPRYLFRQIKWELAIIIPYAIGITYLDEIQGVEQLSIPIGILTILGTTISLILAFRTSQAYERWWEARTIWGAIVNDSRTLIRQILGFATDENDEVKDIQKTISNNQIVWCYALGDALRKIPCSDRPIFSSLKAKTEIEKHKNIPNAILSEQSKLIRELKNIKQIDAYQFVQLDETIKNLTNSMGMSERINNTVFPKMYSMFVDWFLYLFIFLLPFGILDYFHIFEAPVIIGISISFVVLEKIAVIMQDPFRNRPNDTPVTTIAKTIELNIRQMMDADYKDEQSEETSYYVL
jgi:putative membrane protein